jgi:hypothetical protein
LGKADDGVVGSMSEQRMPEANRSLELAKRFRDVAAAETAMPHYAEMMLRAAADLEAFVRERNAAPALIGLRSAA